MTNLAAIATLRPVMILAATAFDQPAPSRRMRAAPLVLSALVHVALLLAWAGFPLPELPEPERVIAVELAVEPQPQPPAQSQPRPAPHETRQIPELQDGALAEQSGQAPAKPATAPPSPRAEPARTPAPVTQNERDVVLSQVLRQWKPPRELVAYDSADIFVAVTVGRDGYFADSFDSRRRWNPGEVFDGYARLHAQDIQRRTVDAFYRAIRQAQPVRLPPALKTKAPFRVRLEFRFKDARR